MKVDYEVPDIPVLAKRRFVADMHFHTSHSHDCQTRVKEIVTLARKLGIHVAFTDHNKVAGVAEALKYKEAPVIPGVEMCSVEGKEVVAYFHDARQLLDFYERRIRPWMRERNAGIRGSRTEIPFRTLIDMLSDEECVTYLPHPFGPQPRRSYQFLSRKTRRDLLGRIDAIEVFNMALTRRSNLSALGWAVQLGKGIAGGSDGHHLKWLGCGVTASKATSVEEHLKAVKRARVHVVGRELQQHQRVGIAQQVLNSKLRTSFQGLKGTVSLKRGKR